MMKPKNTISYSSPHLLAALPQETPVLLAFSGGADSSALLSLLAEDSKNKGYKLYAAHFNHQIRGEEANRDADFCKTTAEKYDVPFFLGTADVPALAKESGNGIENEARVQRYAFFEKIMRERDIPILVTAHHAEDQIETVLLHIIRGCGVAGLSGIKEHRAFSGDLHLVRPLIHAEKSEILAYCEENGIDFVTDSTNCDTSYARNAIRAEITPALRNLQPNLSDVIARLGASAADADDFITAEAEKFIENECSECIPLAKFNSLHPTLKAKVLSLVFEKELDATLERVHIQAVIELAARGEPHSSISLPSKALAKIEDSSIIFTREREFQTNFDYLVPFFEGEAQICDGVTINIEKNPQNADKKSPLSLDVKCEHIGADAHFRTRREGDTVFSGKMNKKIKKLMSEKKVPLEMRNKLPILVSNNEILWIPSVAACDNVKKDKIQCGDSFFRITINLVNN